MAVGGFDFELNGVKYNAAEDAEGDHYVVSGEPLRPPNAVTVQGEASQKFQMRPDALLWTLTDWSGGEGAQKYHPQAPSRWRILQGVRAFETPGKLKAGYYMEDVQDSTGAADLVIDGELVMGFHQADPDGQLWLLDHDSANIYAWDEDNDKFGAATALTGVTNGVRNSASGDDSEVYWCEASTQNVWRRGASGAPSTISTALIDANDTWLAQLGGYVYAVAPKVGKVWEISKTPTTVTEIDDFSDEPGQAVKTGITAMDGKLYILVSAAIETVIREITPTTAAGTGFGGELARIPGFKGSGIWAHAGVLYVAGQLESSGRYTVMYIQPDGAYGTLGELRNGDDLQGIVGADKGSELLDHFFAVESVDGAGQAGIFQVDSVSGGYACISINEDGDAAASSLLNGIAEYQGDVFMSLDAAASTRRTMRARKDQYTKSSYAISAWHDFDLADEKILSSMVLSMEDLPADWQVRVDYAVDGADSWTNVIDNTTDNSNGEKAFVSTDASTVKFRTLSVRVRMDYVGAGVPTTTPVILGIDVLAMVAKPTKVWRLLLDLSDDHSGGQGHSGARKITNLETASETEGVVDFKDGYISSTPGVYDQLDVVIDQYAMNLSQPGEGVAAVVLKEVI